jgi:hypothetical protein
MPTVSRRRSSFTVSSQDWKRANAKLREQREQPPPVTVRFACPVCGGEHTRLEHAAPGCHRLDDRQLQELRVSDVDELVNAVRHDAPLEHIKGVVAVLDAVQTVRSGQPIAVLSRASPRAQAGRRVRAAQLLAGDAPLRQLAADAGMSYGHLVGIIAGREPLLPSDVVDLSRVLRCPPTFLEHGWTNETA